MVAQVRGSDAIKQVGSKLYRGFNLEDPVRLEKYRIAYENFAKGLEDRNKGLLLVGSKGVGKTMMMKILQVLFKDTDRRFMWVKFQELTDLVAHYSTLEIKEMYGGSLKMDLYIDDVGFGAADVKKYGTTINIFSEIIGDRSDLFVYEGFKTHLSSNIIPVPDKRFPNAPTLAGLFGDRVVDRMGEMCQLLAWEGKSLRH